MDAILSGLLSQVKLLLPALPSLLAPYILEYGGKGGKALKRLFPRRYRKAIAMILGTALGALGGGLGYVATGDPAIFAGGTAGGFGLSMAGSSGVTVGKMIEKVKAGAATKQGRKNLQ